MAETRFTISINRTEARPKEDAAFTRSITECIEIAHTKVTNVLLGLANVTLTPPVFKPMRGLLRAVSFCHSETG